MTKTRMEERVDQVERNVMSNLEQYGSNASRTGATHDLFSARARATFNKLESMIASLARGKSTFLEGDSSSQATPGSTFQTIPPAANALVVEEFPMAVKKIELPNFDEWTLWDGGRIDGPTVFGFLFKWLWEEIRVRIHSQDSIDHFRTMNLAREIELEIQFLTSKLSLKHVRDSSHRWGSVIGPGPRNDMGRYVKGTSTWSKPILPSPSTKLLEYPNNKPPDKAFRDHLNSYKIHLPHQQLALINHRFIETEAPAIYTSGGLCYKCKQPFHPMHECPNKTLRALIVGDDEQIPIELEQELGLVESETPNVMITDEAHFNRMELPFIQ
ncbi:hypothetical protein GH714_000965 [Hevea brasiliensis]|uniref:Uncharacterized protein n=1 Tax=Hevea brasiliensis TaxID=3981 RepID=A0A6A6M9N7_HEVBR|nr:hypothetical protein GH714_000965 [Hevea brasiliensis]